MLSCPVAQLSNTDMRIFLEALSLENPSLFEAMQRESLRFGDRTYQEKVRMIREVINLEIRKLQISIEESLGWDEQRSTGDVVFLGVEDGAVGNSQPRKKRRGRLEEAADRMPSISRPDASWRLDQTGT